jgi:hypothetical protein
MPFIQCIQEKISDSQKSRGKKVIKVVGSSLGSKLRMMIKKEKESMEAENRASALERK